MSIAACTEAFVAHLRGLLEASGAAEGWTVAAHTVRLVARERTKSVALVLWRVQPNEPPDDEPPMRVASLGDPPRGTGLNLRYMLLAQGATSTEEQAMLGLCMTVLDRNAVVPLGGTMTAAETLVVHVETPDDVAYLRLLALLGDDAPTLMLPYLVRCVPTLPPMAEPMPDNAGR